MQHGGARDSEVLVNVSVLEKHGIKKTTAYELARLGKIPSYKVGTKQSGVRFILSEVLAALRSVPNEADPK